MKNFTPKPNSEKKLSTRFMAAGYILITGMIGGAYLMHQVDINTTSKTAQAVQAALKTIPVAQASAPVK